MHVEDVVHDGLPLFLHGSEDGHLLVDSPRWAVRGHGGHLELVRLCQFKGFGGGGARHSRNLGEISEEHLVRDGCHRCFFPLDPQPLLRLHRLVNVVGPPAVRHRPPRALVDDAHLLVFDDVVAILEIVLFGKDRGEDEDAPRRVLGPQILHAQQRLRCVHALVGEEGRLLRFVRAVVHILLEPRRHLRRLLPAVLRVIHVHGNNERVAALVD
mmetsp:Transcript_27652/g.90432  ORF Transcript_27652/g.90432 Transcript_27652/m.90432 type:complete len:213 (+) Transcript_27652:2145-2783(+)